MSENLINVEFVEKIDEFVEKVVFLEIIVLFYIVLVKILRLDIDELYEYICVVEEDKVSYVLDFIDMKRRVIVFEDELSKVRDFF